jgi:hypothetical protein
LNNAVDVLNGMLGVESEEAKRCLRGEIERRERGYEELKGKWRYVGEGGV